MHNFVVFSLSRWNIEYGCNIKDICIELSRNHKVLYVDVPLKRKDRWLKRDTAPVKEVLERVAAKQELLKVNDNLFHYIGDTILESVNSIKNNFLFDQINYQNNKRFAGVLKHAIAAAGFTEYILINDNDIYNGMYLRKLLNPNMYVYYLRDRLPAMQYWKRQTSRLESTLITRADLILANSTYLAEYASTYNKESYYVGQGCDVGHFLNPPVTAVPEDIAGIPRPIVGYIGALNQERLDISLIEKVAQALPGFSFVLIGKEDDGFQKSNLHNLKNVYFLGLKPFEMLPTYAHHFDVCFNPQVMNEITIGNYPRKIDEYLATGKPVVATDTKAMEIFSAHTYLGKTAEDYTHLIQLAVNEDSPQRAQARREFAKEHTWEASVAEMIKEIEKLYESKGVK